MNMRPPPPPTLSKEYSRVWIGWCMIGDREVAREAAAKGIYIDLALQFIATRKEWDHSDVERWFKSEIFSWVYQLVEQKQIYKASHILLNIGSDPNEQLSIIISETTNKIIRDYIAEHLQKNGKLEIHILNYWKFILAIEKSNSILFNNIWEDVSQISIQKLEQKNNEWKSNIAAILFFHDFDFHLESFLTAESSWNNLLTYEKLDILKLWINIFFSKDLNYDCKINISQENYQKLKNMFLVWEITINMINQIKTKTYQQTIKELVLTELSNYGIFTDDEKHNIPQIVSRLCKKQNFENIFNILQEPFSCININDFYDKLNDFSIVNELYEILTICPIEYNINPSLINKNNEKQLSLWLRKKDYRDIKVTDEVLLKHIITALNYFANGDINLYLKNNPIILIAIILFTKDTSFTNIIVNNNDLIIDNIKINSELIINYLNQLPAFKNILAKFISKIPEDHNIYELIKKQSNLANALDFRSNFNEIPHFNNKYMSEKYGRSESLNYFYYIKQYRPSIAAKLFVLYQMKKYGKIEEHELKNASNKIFKLVLKNDNTTSEMLSSCVAFLEMIGISTNELRVIISSMNLIKSSEICTGDEIKLLFINFDSNCHKILSILENILLSKYNIKENNFINIIKNFELIINFARINNLELPEKFLILCAENNLWLQFLIFVQKYDYPLEQTLKLSLCFKNKEIFEHIHHAIATEIEPDIDISFSSSLLSTSVTSCDLEPKASENNSDFSIKSNLLKILIQCHKSEDPPTALLQAAQNYENSLLTVLAACYEPDSVVINWLIWLSISTNVNIFKAENCSVNPNAVSNFLENVLSKKFVRTLLESLEIFIPENPLYLLVQFLYNAVQSNFNFCIEYLKLFEKSINHLNFNSVLMNNDFEYTYLTNSYWLIHTALKLIFATLGNCFTSKENQIKFLNILCTAEFAKNVPIEYPNFCAISHLLQTISTNIKIDLSVFLDLDKRREEIMRCVEELVHKKKFKDAIEFTKYENICKEYVLNEKWTNKFKHQPSSDFLIKSDAAFKSADISPCSAAQFYVYCCINYNENHDKYKALKYAYSWLKKSNYSDRFIENVEHDIWLNYFALDDDTLKKSHYDKHETNYLLSEIKQRIITSTQFDNELNRIQMRHFDETVGKILEVGDVIEALRLEKMFNQKHPETGILLTCYELAEGNLKPYEISAEQRLLFLNRDRNLKSAPHRRRTVNKSTRTTSTGSYDSIQTVFPTITENDESNPQDTLTLLETMTDRLKYGSNIGSRILMCYRISINVNIAYQEVVKHTDSKNLLKTALENDCRNKVDVIHDIFVIYKWDKLEITEFILEELQKAIKNSINLNLDSVYMWDLELDSQFHLVLQLCSETNSLLGKELLTITSVIQESEMSCKNIDLKEINMIVELLVRAHDCFNAYCNMEGIASVLRKAQTVSSILLNLKQWKLMVRLLTGIGKYTEMNYIFQILKENDQFEFLLKRNYRQNNALKVALLKYLKKHCPKNQDLYRIVALHFTLFSEVAELWENEANEMIKNLIEIAKLEVQNQKRNFDLQIVLFCNNESTKLCLHKVMDNFSHAAEYHLHGEKLISAMKAAKQAELIALQISLLKNLPNNNSTTNCILKLSPKEILEMISSELSFNQSKILVEAYNYQVDWGTVLYKQCILNGKIDYLEEYLISKPLTNTLVQDLTRRFLAEKNLSQVAVKSMKDILRRLDSVHMKYRLASELGFGDVIESLLTGTQLAYLKDTVWKKGYKQL